MYERFTERARQVVVLSQDEAHRLGVRYVGSEHLLLGLLREEEGLAARVLTDLGVIYGTAYEVVDSLSQGEKPEDKRQLPFTPRAQKCLELALREALNLGHNYIGTEHVLLGVIREGNNEAVKILTDSFLLSGEKVREAIIKELSGTRKPYIGERIRKEEPKDEPDLDVIASAVTLGRLYPNVRAEAIAKAAISFAE